MPGNGEHPDEESLTHFQSGEWNRDFKISHQKIIAQIERLASMEVAEQTGGEGKLAQSVLRFIEAISAEVFYGSEGGAGPGMKPIRVQQSEVGMLARFASMQVGHFDHDIDPHLRAEYQRFLEKFDRGGAFAALGAAETMRVETERQSLSYPVRQLVIGEKDGQLIVDVELQTKSREFTDELRRHAEIIQFIHGKLVLILDALTDQNFFLQSYNIVTQRQPMPGLRRERRVRTAGGSALVGNVLQPERENAYPGDMTQVWNYLEPWLLDEYIPKNLNKRSSVLSGYAEVIKAISGDQGRERLYPAVQLFTLYQLRHRHGDDGQITHAVTALHAAGVHVSSMDKDLLMRIIMDRSLSEQIAQVLNPLMPPGSESAMQRGGGHYFVGGGVVSDLKQECAENYGKVMLEFMRMSLEAGRTGKAPTLQNTGSEIGRLLLGSGE